MFDMGEKLSILLVEDNLLNQRIVTFSLKKYDHDVVIANNGVEAIERFREKKFHVILMDIMMPVMDGLEATIKIREEELLNGIIKRTPIIALTANTMDNDRDKCISYGMDEFMSKPFDIEKLKTIFAELEITA
jgi:CheY-like chemotaxis protein